MTDISVGLGETLRASRLVLDDLAEARRSELTSSPDQLANHGLELVSALEALENLAGALANKVRRHGDRLSPGPSGRSAEAQDAAADHLDKLRHLLSVAAFHAHIYTAVVSDAGTVANVRHP